ncbi:sensor histidine kinase [Paenibacillus sp. IB182496]|uniref:histidine kinase n=1 Tax=Paenibacillus sabuli TaxID=2772509 RepID=A0A927BRL0_9BACL|nr:sensor histidine kinase [Paenibacillus sabuli]MBD2845472.1 sensor histidine kinase [Paenibacillus sabuli]
MIKLLGHLFVRFSNGIIRLLRSITIFQRLIAAFLVLVLVPTVFITLFTYSKYVNEIEKNMESFLSLLVQNVNVQIQDKFSLIERLAILFYTDANVIAGIEGSATLPSDSEAFVAHEAVIGHRLLEIAIHNENILMMEVITPDHQFFMRDEYGNRRGGYIRDPERFRASEYYKAAIAQHGYPVWFDTSNENDIFYKSPTALFGVSESITMTQAIYNTDTRKFLGVLVINLQIEYLTESLRSYAFYGSGNTFLFGKNGVIKGIHSDLSAPHLSELRSIDQVLGQATEGSYSGRLNQVNVFLVYKQVPYTDLSVVHVVDRDKLLGQAYRIRNLCLTLVAGLILVSLLVLYWTTISISRPLQKLMKAMRTFAKDHFSVNYKPSGRDELTVLGEQFVDMTVNTKQLVDQIYIAEIREKSLQLSKSQAELNALQMQINPHFLYNTLDIIRWEALYEADGESTVSRMIDDFCRLMRMSITTGEDTVTVRSELNYAETYIGVINFRHRDQIALHIHMDFDPDAYRMPKFTLQPLMENAVQHAFDEDVSQAVIRIEGRRDGDEIRIRIEDNGMGMDEETLTDIRRILDGDEPPAQGIALDNVNRRLKLSYGDRYGLSISSSPAGGTAITVSIPASGSPPAVQ